MERTCPICGETYTEHPAISRKDNKTEICPECGLSEALENYAKNRKMEETGMEELRNKLVENGYDAEIVELSTATGGVEKALSVYGRIGEEKSDKFGIVCRGTFTVADYDNVIKDFDKRRKEMLEGLGGIEAIKNSFQDCEKYLLCVRPKNGGKDDIITKDFLDLELYVRLDLGSHTVTITQEILDKYIKITEDELFEIAKENLKKTFTAVPIEYALGFVENINDAIIPILVVRNNKNLYGASVIAILDELLKENLEFFVLPCSIHEIICVPIFEGDDRVVDAMQYSNLIQKLNHEIKDSDELANHPYIFKEGKLDIA